MDPDRAGLKTPLISQTRPGLAGRTAEFHGQGWLVERGVFMGRQSYGSPMECMGIEDPTINTFIPYDWSLWRTNLT